MSSLCVLSQAKVLAKECIEEGQDEKEEAGEEEVEQEASQVPASDDQVAPEADPYPSKNAHFRPLNSYASWRSWFSKALMDTQHKDESS